MSLMMKKFLNLLLDLLRNLSEMMLHSWTGREMKSISLPTGSQNNLLASSSNESVKLDFHPIIQLLESIFEDLGLLEYLQESSEMLLRLDILVSDLPEMLFEQ